MLMARKKEKSSRRTITKNGRYVAADAVIIRGEKLLLIRRGTGPFKGMLALPGGYLGVGERAEECVVREAFEETGIRIIPLGIVGVYSDPKRDPRGTVSVAYLCAYGSGTEKAGGDAKSAEWVSIKSALNGKLAFDHKRIVKDALKALKKKVGLCQG